MRFQGIVEELESLHSDLVNLKRIRALGSLLQIVIVGFLILRHVDRKILGNARAAHVIIATHMVSSFFW